MKVSILVADANTYMLKYFLLITYLQWSMHLQKIYLWTNMYTILKQQKPFKKSHQVKKLTKTCHPRTRDHLWLWNAN